MTKKSKNCCISSGHFLYFFFDSLFFSHLDVAFFSSSLEKYTTEHTLVENVPDRKAIGMLLLDCLNLKKVLIPSPLKCLSVSA